MARQPLLRISHDELIVDNFAGGGGASLGIEMALGRSPDIAINHDEEAISMHRANHPSTRHYCENVWKIDPVEACRGRPVGLAWFSPDCKHFSKAKGGKPVDKNIRGLAWVVVKWAKAVRPRVIILENVEEFQQWGPLGTDGKPCPFRKGFTFRRWKATLENLGYKIDHREMSACDFGAPTTRKRFFLVARRDGQPIVWPEATHGPGLLPYRTAAECIDWTLPTYSIFLNAAEGKRYGVRRPLAENTMRRIARGLQKFVLDSADPFIVGIDNSSNGDRDVWSGHAPIRTITAENRFAVATPFITKFRTGSTGTAIDTPLHTITAGPKQNPAGAAHAMGLVAPVLVPRYGEREGQEPRARSIDRPFPTIVPTANGAGLVTAFMAKHYGGHETPGSAMPAPFDTITARDHHALVASHLVKLKGTCRDGQPLTAPLHTVQAGGNHYAEVRAFLMKYHRDGGQLGGLLDPMPTVLANDSLGLVTVAGEPYAVVDIGMRMLDRRELFTAQGFPRSYIIDTTHDGKPLTKEASVRMCGNSVSPPNAAAIARAQFEDVAMEIAI